MSDINTVIKLRRKSLAVHILAMGKLRNSYKLSTEKSEGNKSLRRTKRRCEDDIIIYLKDTE
jgi:hypothetical protein